MRISLYAYIITLARINAIWCRVIRNGRIPLLFAAGFCMGNRLAPHAPRVELGGALVELFLQPLAALRRSYSDHIMVEVGTSCFELADPRCVLVRERRLSVVGSATLAAYVCAGSTRLCYRYGSSIPWQSFSVSSPTAGSLIMTKGELKTPLTAPAIGGVCTLSIIISATLNQYRSAG